MGVLHMAIPAPTPLSANFLGRLPRRRLRPLETQIEIPTFSQVLPVAPTPVPPVALQAVDSQTRVTAAQGTLLQAPPLEVQTTLERTPQQIAEQEATLKLVRQCVAGEQQAWAQLVASQHRRIYGICYRFTNSACDAEDLTQDVFIKVYKNLNSFDLQKGSFQTWMTTLARNLLVDHFRRTRLDRASDSLDASLGSDEDGPTIGDRLMDSGISQDKHVAGLELKATIQDALKQLSPELREAVILRDLEDMDYKEIAQVLRIPEGTVKSRISRGRGELARLLQRIEGQVM